MQLAHAFKFPKPKSLIIERVIGWRWTKVLGLDFEIWFSLAWVQIQEIEESCNSVTVNKQLALYSLFFKFDTLPLYPERVFLFSFFFSAKFWEIKSPLFTSNHCPVLLLLLLQVVESHTLSSTHHFFLSLSFFCWFLF